jgi:hypothetical protein
LNPTNDEVTAQLAQFLEDRSVVQKEFVDSSNKATEKNNNTTSTSTSNGNGNYSGNSNYSGKNTNSNSIILAASASAPALLQQEHGKGTLSTAGLITVSNDDRVQFMLNPKVGCVPFLLIFHLLSTLKDHRILLFYCCFEYYEPIVPLLVSV